MARETERDIDELASQVSRPEIKRAACSYEVAEQREQVISSDASIRPAESGFDGGWGAKKVAGRLNAALNKETPEQLRARGEHLTTLRAGEQNKTWHQGRQDARNEVKAEAGRRFWRRLWDGWVSFRERSLEGEDSQMEARRERGAILAAAAGPEPQIARTSQAEAMVREHGLEREMGRERSREM